MSNFKFVTFVLTFAVAGCAATPNADDASGDTSDQALTSFACADSIGDLAGNGEEQGGGVVAAARAGGHPGFDRFVLEFTGKSVPPWQVSRNPSATFGMDGSGKPVPLRGQAGLLVAVQTSMYYDGWSSPEGGTPFTGPLHFTPAGTTVLTEAANIGDFENVHSWGLGLTKAACYRVFELQNPARLVIDIETN